MKDAKVSLQTLTILVKHQVKPFSWSWLASLVCRNSEHQHTGPKQILECPDKAYFHGICTHARTYVIQAICLIKYIYTVYLSYLMFYDNISGFIKSYSKSIRVSKVVPVNYVQLNIGIIAMKKRWSVRYACYS